MRITVKNWFCFIFILIALNACKKSNISKIETKQFHNIEMVEYCLPIPKTYIQNHEYSMQVSKGQHQFISNDKNKPKITFKGNLLNVSFSTLQETIKSQLAKMEGNSEIINSNNSSISYTFENNGQVFFEKKWLLDDSTVTATIAYSSNIQTDFFEQLKNLYLSTSPNCK